MTQELVFVNGAREKCGCVASYSDGGGEYSNVIRVKLCDVHSLDDTALNYINNRHKYHESFEKHASDSVYFPKDLI